MKVLLATLHSKYAHSSLALPCLKAYCRDLDGIELSIKEFTTNEKHENVLAAIIKEEAPIIAFSCYIWNSLQTLKLAGAIRDIRPGTFIILGGPEVSFDASKVLKANPCIDFIARGEGESTFRQLLQALSASADKAAIKNIRGLTFRQDHEIIDNGPAVQLAELDQIPSPFAAGLVDLNKPLIYYETSRGCPFTCAFCLSSIEERVRSFSMGRIKSDLACLMKSGKGTIKFVDRTFNFNAKRANEIWSFIIENGCPGKYHFEIAADLLTDENIDLLKNVPEETFRFEIGVQSIAEETLHSVGRGSDLERLFANVRRLTDETKVKVHLDLVAGLPGEDFRGFQRSLERLFSLRPHHIQVEPLKVLKGAPMMDIAVREGYLWADLPPYRVISSPWLCKDEVESIETIGRLLELIYNSSRFTASLDAIAALMPLSDFFASFARFWKEEEIRSLSMDELFEVLWRFMEDIVDEEKRGQLADAMTFDRLMADYPNLKRMPSYFRVSNDYDYRVSKDVIAGLREQLKISARHKVRAIRWYFGKDYREVSKEGTVRLTFLYISIPGMGQEVKIISHADSTT